WRKDLKLRNPHTVPLTLKVTIGEDRLTAGFWSVEARPFRVTILSDILPVEPEAVVSGAGGMPGTVVQHGGRGYSVITRRCLVREGRGTEEILSRDFYPPPSRILAGEGP
ncbi:MAG: vanomycin resistance protein VanB, partial [Geobacteraceae bacterium]|nr:vanomycin resistance protein VanB [Geobacteraceae bacterium]